MPIMGEIVYQEFTVGQYYKALLRVDLYIQLFFTRKIRSGNKINVDIKWQKHAMKI